MLVTSKKVFQQAQKKSFAIPATNFIDLDSARTFVETAEKLKKPLILPFAQSHRSIISLEEAALIGKHFSEKSDMPVVLHLDHGEDLDFIEQAIRLGFTSVMIDASQDTLSENIRKTKEVVKLAHANQVVVEAEMGHVGSGVNYENHDQTDSVYTEVNDAVRFVKETNVDSLEVSIGTAHGYYKGDPHINFERLSEITSALSVPLVLHGGSSSGDDNLEKCAQSGICKINIFTDFINGALESIRKGDPDDYLSLKQVSNETMEKILTHYFEVFGTKSVGEFE